MKGSISLHWLRNQQNKLRSSLSLCAFDNPFELCNDNSMNKGFLGTLVSFTTHKEC